MPATVVANQPDWVRLEVGTVTTSTSEKGSIIATLPGLLTLGSDYQGNGSVEVKVRAPKGYFIGESMVVKQTLLLTPTKSPSAPNLPVILTGEGAEKPGGSQKILVLDVTVSDPSGFYPDRRFRKHFQRAGASLEQLTGSDVLASTTLVQTTELLLKADEHTSFSPVNADHRDPTTDPSLSIEEREHAAMVIAAAESEAIALAQKKGSMAYASPDEPSAPDATGCRAGSGPGTGTCGFALVLVVGGGLLLARRRRPGSAAVALAALVALSSADARASVCYVDGWLSFWDMRTSYHFPDVGARHPLCQTGACNPDTPNCCWRGLSVLSLSLYKVSSSGMWTWVSTSRTTGTGYFVLWDPDCDTSATYGIGFEFSRRQYPAHVEMRVAGHAYPIRVLLANTLFSLLPGVANTLHIGNLALNQEGDDSSNVAAAGASWRTLWDTHLALEAETELRFRKNFGSTNAYDAIYVNLDFAPPPGRASTAACASSTINLVDGDLWDATPAHEMGHIAHGRVVGCAGNAPAFGYGDNSSDAWKVDGPEGAMGESIAGLIQWLTVWNPATTEITSLTPPDRWPCIDMSSHHGVHHFNSNDLSNPRNRVHALWDLIDTSTNNADSYADAVDVTLKDLFDAMVVWKSGACVPGQNGSPCEARATTWLEQVCDFALDCVTCLDQAAGCGWGDTCERIDSGPTRYCRTGDTHGTNVADWTAHLATLVGGHVPTFQQTLASSPCVADAQNAPVVPANSPPLPTQGYFGGFHSD